MSEESQVNLVDILHGRILWFGLMSNDVESAKSFYGQVIGWEFEQGKMPGSEKAQYTAQINDEPMASFMSIPDQADPDVRPAWRVLVAVSDVDAAAKKAIELGGKLLIPITGEKESLRYCVIRDPQGAIVHLITPTEEYAMSVLMPSMTMMDESNVEDTEASKDQAAAVKVLEKMRHLGKVFG